MAIGGSGLPLGKNPTEVRLIPADTHKTLLTLPAVGSQRFEIPNVVFRSDGKAVAFPSYSNELIVYDSKKGEPLFKIKDKGAERFYRCEFTRTGKLLATGGGWRSGFRSCHVKLWDGNTGEFKCELQIHRKANRINGLAFSFDDKYLASSTRNRIIVSEIATGKTVFDLALPSGGGSVSMSPTENLLVVAQNTNIEFYEIPSGKKRFQLKGFSKTPNSMRFSTNGKFFISSAYRDPKIRIWRVNSDAKTEECKLGAVSGGLQHLTQHGEWLAGVNRKEVVLRKIGNPNPQSLYSHTYRITDLSFSETGDRLLSVDTKGNIRSWNLTTQKEDTGCKLTSLADRQQPKFVNHGKHIYGLQKNGRFVLWNADTGEIVSKVDLPNSVHNVVLGNDLRTLAYADKHRTAILDLKSKNTSELPLEEGNHIPICFDENNSLLAVLTIPKDSSGHFHAIVHVVDCSTMSVVFTHPVFLKHQPKLVFSPDSKRLLIYDRLSTSGQIQFWDLHNRQRIFTLDDCPRKLHEVTFSREGHLIITGIDGSVRILKRK